MEHDINTGVSMLPFPANGRIEESQSPWSSPVVLVRRHDGSYRMCIDYRKLNLCTSKDAISLGRTDDVLEALTQNSILDPWWTSPLEGYAF